MPLVNLPNEKRVYRLPVGAKDILGSAPTGGFYGQVPWSTSARVEDLDFLGLQPGGLQVFGPYKGQHPAAILWEADADVDSDGPGGSIAEDKYWQNGTTLHWPDKRSCNSHSFLGVVIPPQLTERYGLRMGDSVLVVNRGIAVVAQAYDIGPRRKIGEMSMACARALGIGSNPNRGNDEQHVCYMGFVGSGTGYALDPTAQGLQFQAAWNKFTGRPGPFWGEK